MAMFPPLPGRRVLVAVLSLLIAVFSAKAEDTAIQHPQPALSTHWGIVAECQMIVLPQKLALTLIPDLSDDTKIEAAWTKLQQMIGKDDVSLAANLTLRGESGVKLMTQSVQEVRYPTEFTPPQLPGSVGDKYPENSLKNWPLVSITPTAFEKRDVGPMMELETDISEDGQWISATVTAQHVRLVKFAKYDAGVLASGEHLNMEQPYFSEVKNNASFHVRAGQRILFGIHNVPGEEDKMELFFLKIRADRVGGVK